MAKGIEPAASGGIDTAADSRWVDEAAGHGGHRLRRLWHQIQRHRLNLLLALTLAGTLVMLGSLQWLAHQPRLPGDWRVESTGVLLLDSAPGQGLLESYAGQTLVAVMGPGRQRIMVQSEALPVPLRWIADDERRRKTAQAWADLSLAAELAQPGRPWMLEFRQREPLAWLPVSRGWAGLGPAAWGLALLGLALYMVMLVVLSNWRGRDSRLYALLALAHLVILATTAAQLLPGPWPPAALGTRGLPLQLLAELLASAAAVHLVLRIAQPGCPAWVRGVVWALAAATALATLANPGSEPVTWTAALSAAGAICCAALLLRTRGLVAAVPSPNLVRLGLTGAVVAIGAALAWVILGDARPGDAPSMGLAGPAWSATSAALVLAAPLVMPLRHATRELAWLLAVAALTLVLYILFAAAVGLGGWTSLLLTAAATVALVAALRPMIVRHLSSAGTMSAERLFDRLYRSARDLEQSPQRAAEHVSALLRDVFDPLEVTRNHRPLSRVRIARDGSAMAVPVPVLSERAPALRVSTTVLLRHARRGQRLFSEDDRALAERMLEQLRRAVAYDRAVERGRAEERTRIAQDLHDDIGARLLTLMYKAPNTEIEEYIRHTLQDLKTLTRGLAAANPRLSHAAAEWKADISQRLHPTGCDLHWSFTAERDMVLNVVQWSGLTRVLRELVNNVITHAQATQVEVALHYDGQWLTLMLADDGIGRLPEQWSPGLGLGGVRKRVKQLGGQVRWSEHNPNGIRCDIRLQLAQPDAVHDDS